ncbi:MAG: hypothetical protein H0W41_01320 [Chloroflexi bacterium]|nr:hypothetical protein [Chloroflexota bacterium]
MRHQRDRLGHALGSIAEHPDQPPRCVGQCSAVSVEWAIAGRHDLSEGSMARLDPGRDDEVTEEVERAKTVLLAS